MSVPSIRIRVRNDSELNSRGDYILYWMIGYRRLTHNFALQRAVEWASELRKPLVIFEPLRIGYPFASDRLHRFILDGMADHARALAKSRALYFPYVEPEKDADKGLLFALAKNAAVIVTDDFPTFFLPRMIEKVAPKLPVKLEQVDSNGLVPVAAEPRVFGTAHSFRVWLAKNVESFLAEFPDEDPLSRLPKVPRAELPSSLLKRWKSAARELLDGDAKALSRLPVDHSVPISTAFRGGSSAARERLELFVREKLSHYAEERSRPEVDGSSRLSPWLHFGQLSVHEILERLMRAEKVRREKLKVAAKAKRRSLFGLSPAAETFIDELVTWRELGINYCSKRSDYTSYDAIPEWSRRTLSKHEKDPRPHRYTREQLEHGETHDPFFNAAARQLLSEGWFHNQARMYWGKRILEWSRTGEEALETMTSIMNRLSLDGRDPNSFTGYAWTLGKYDRPQGPERKIFGTVRPMPLTDERLRRARLYIEQWAPGEYERFKSARRKGK